MRFRDRSDAGRQLASQLTSFANQPNVCVLALPRGGVPVAYEVARRLHALLDIWVVRKLGAPGMPELAIGAIASGGVQVLSPGIVRALNLPPGQIEEIAAREKLELARRETAYRGNRPPATVQFKHVILIDDGIATGSTMRAAIAALRPLNPIQIVVAVPVAARSVCDHLSREADAVICLLCPPNLDAVGQWYDDFSQTSDDEVRDLLSRSIPSPQSAPV